MFKGPKNPTDPQYISNSIRREHYPSRTTHPTLRDLISTYHASTSVNADTTTQRYTECSQNTYHVATFPVQETFPDLTIPHFRPQRTQDPEFSQCLE